MKKTPCILSNLIWRYFLNKVSFLHCNLRLILPQARSLSLRSYQYRSRIRIFWLVSARVGNLVGKVLAEPKG